MSIKTKIAALALATLAATGTLASSTQRAEAGNLGWQIGAGLVGAAIVGTAIANSGNGYNNGNYYGGYRRCGWVRQFDSYGNYMGSVRACDF